MHQVGVLDLTQQKRFQYSKLIQDFFDTLCKIEYDIINKELDPNVFDEVIQSSKNIIEKIDGMPNYILIKIMQISQLLLQLNHLIFDDRIKEFQQFVQKYNDDSKQLNLKQVNLNSEIYKAQIFDEELEIKYVALSLDEKYLLVGTSRQVYLYDIQTKLNIVIHKGFASEGLFSQNSTQIILLYINRITIIDIYTRKKHYFQNKDKVQSCFIDKNYLYFCTFCNQTYSSRLIKTDLKTNRQIFSYYRPYYVQIDIFQNLLAIQSRNYLQILNQNSMKYELKIQIQEFKIKKLFLINKNEILSNNDSFQLIIWNIDYQNNILIKTKVLPFFALFLLRGKPNFRYFYIINYIEYQIIDEEYNSIYIYQENIFEQCALIRKSIQLNTHRIFIIEQQDMVYILKRLQQADI